MTETEYLERKPDRTIEETAKLLRLRLKGDDTADDARLFIAYRESGAFRRVLADGITGIDIRRLCDAVLGPEPQP
jgi:hypothetical protein